MRLQEHKIEAVQRHEERLEFKYSLENLRGLSILFVILSHVTSFEALGKSGHYLSFFFGDATAWFVFISGYLFNHVEQPRFKYWAYLKRKTKFVFLPYLILSVPAIIVGLVFQRDVVTGLEPQAYVLWSLLVGGTVIVPMWFVPMIGVFFIVSPLFYRLGSSRIQYATMIAGLAISLFTSRPVDNLNPFLSFVHFFGFYVFGIVLSENFSSRAEFKDKVSVDRIVIVSLMLFAASFFVYFFAGNTEPLGFFDGLGEFNNLQFGKLSLLVAVFFLFDRFLNVRNRFFGWVAEMSFGLFFMHGFFMALFMKLGQNMLISQPMMMLALELSLLLGGSMLAVFVVKMIFGKRSRYVIGF